MKAEIVEISLYEKEENKTSEADGKIRRARPRADLGAEAALGYHSELLPKAVPLLRFPDKKQRGHIQLDTPSLNYDFMRRYSHRLHFVR